MFSFNWRFFHWDSQFVNVKVKGTVIGYITPEVGIIEVWDSKREAKKVKIWFNACSLFIFRFMPIIDSVCEDR